MNNIIDEDIFSKIGTAQPLSQRIERRIEDLIREKSITWQNYLPNSSYVSFFP